MTKRETNITHVPISKKNESVVDFIRTEIKAKKERHEAIVKSMNEAFIQRLNKISKTRIAK